MADVTVGTLAKAVGTTVERLLEQMAEAGIPQADADALVSDADKKVLLVFLKNSHGSEDAGETKKITLKRKTLTKLKAPTSVGKKTINVEVRKKRTYVKRDAEDLAAQQVLEEEKQKKQKTAEQEQGVSIPTALATDDIELKRQAATQARKDTEEKERKVREEQKGLKTEKEKTANASLKSEDSESKKLDDKT